MHQNNENSATNWIHSIGKLVQGKLAQSDLGLSYNFEDDMKLSFFQNSTATTRPIYVSVVLNFLLLLIGQIQTSSKLKSEALFQYLILGVCF